MTDFSDLGLHIDLTDEEAEVALKQFFQQRGYVRIADEERRAKSAEYKKGWEVRLVAKTESELMVIRDWLKQVDFKPGKPFRKSRRLVQPIYGKKALKWFLSEE